MKTINLTLKRTWFNMILSGIKQEEYREDTRYWNSRFFNSSDCSWKDYDTVMFHEGYRNNRRRMLVQIIDIGLGTGRPDWGAIEAKRCFIISLGKILETYNC